MASTGPERHPAIVERLQQLYGAIKMLQKMVGTDVQWDEQSGAILTTDAAAAKKLYVSACKNLHDTVTRFTLIFKDSKTPEEVGTYAETMERALVGIVQTHQQVLKITNAHDLLRQQMVLLVSDILDVSSKLSNAMSTTFNFKDANRMTGQIWSDCDVLEQLNLDATLKEFVSISIRSHLSAIKDAITELTEEEENADEDDDDEEEDDGDKNPDDDLLAGFTLKAADRKILPGCVILLKAASSFCQQILNLIQAVDESKDVEQTKAALLQTWALMKNVIETVDNLNTAIYPPQNVPEVLSNCTIMRTIAKDIAKLFADLPQLSAQHARIGTLVTTADAIFQKAEDKIKDP